MWGTARLHRSASLQLNHNGLKCTQHIQSVTACLNTRIDKTTVTVMRGFGWWNQERASTNNRTPSPPYFGPLDRRLPISCSSYCNISVHCLHKAVVLTQHICNSVKYIIKNIITHHPHYGSQFQNNFQHLTPILSQIGNHNLRVIEWINTLQDSFSRRSVAVLPVDSLAFVLTKETHDHNSGESCSIRQVTLKW